MNTRRFPRTLGEAFKDASYACAVERPASRRMPIPWIAVVLTVLLSLVAARS